MADDQCPNCERWGGTAILELGKGEVVEICRNCNYRLRTVSPPSPTDTWIDNEPDLIQIGRDSCLPRYVAIDIRELRYIAACDDLAGFAEAVGSVSKPKVALKEPFHAIYCMHCPKCERFQYFIDEDSAKCSFCGHSDKVGKTEDLTDVSDWKWDVTAFVPVGTVLCRNCQAYAEGRIGLDGSKETKWACPTGKCPEIKWVTKRVSKN